MSPTAYVLATANPSGGYPPTWGAIFVAWTDPGTDVTASNFVDYQGTVAFVETMPADMNAFIDEVALTVGPWAASPISFVWMGGEQTPASGMTGVLAEGAGGGTVLAPFIWRRNNYALVIGTGCTVSIANLPDYLTYSVPKGGAGSIYFVADYGGAVFQLSSVDLSITAGPPSSTSSVPPCPTGAFYFDIDAAMPVDLQALSIGFRYFVDDPDRPGWGRVRGVDFPFVAGQGPNVILPFQLFPDGGMTIVPDDPTALFLSGFSAWNGPISLSPVTDSSPVFDQMTGALTMPPGPDDPFFFSPFGPWAPAAGTTPLNVIGGLSGAEYFANLAKMYFTASPTTGAYVSLSDSQISAAITTSWSQMTGSTYYAQPEGATYYEVAGAGPALGYLELPSNGANVTANYYPMVPFGGVSAADLPLAIAIEKKALSVVRVQSLDPPAGAPNAPTTALLPQGMMAVWATANESNYNLQVGNTPDSTITFTSVTGTLADDLQTSQLFLVCSDFSTLTATLPTQPVTVGDWTFDVFNASSNDGPQTVLVFKFASGTFGDLVANTGAWTNASTYNPNGVTSAQALLQASIAQAEEAYAAGATEYTYFVETVLNDPHWNGMIAFNVTLGEQTLPQPLAAAIGDNVPIAHHWGIAVSPIQVLNDVVTFGNSSMFAVVDYNAPSPLTTDDGSYAFQLQQLTMYFESSTLVTQSASIALLVPQLFGEAVALQDTTIGNNLIFDGTFQPDGSIAFALSGPAVFTVESAVLSDIEISSAQLVQVTTDSNQWQFVLNGDLGFRNFADFDLFSYDGLHFDGATITVDISTQPATWIGFDASATTLNPLASTIRPDSLFASLPIQASSFLQAAPGTTPASLGYLGVQTPVPQGAFSTTAQWYGLVCDLNLGNPGSLVPLPFNATLLAAWSPSPWTPGSPPPLGPPKIAFGLIFPGTSQTAPTTSSLQGILQLKFGDIQLSTEDNGSYVLALSSVALSFFGLSFPPFGQTNAYFFGAPAGSAASIGWYLGYAEAAG